MNLPTLSRDELMPLLAAGAAVLTANGRLPGELRRQYGAWQKGRTVFDSPSILHLPVWLGEAMDEAILAGRLPPTAAARRVLSGFEERVLWEQAIRESEAGGLLDVQSLAQAAQEALELALLWDISWPDALSTEESRHFVRWRQAFEAACRHLNVQPAGAMQRQYLDWLADGRLAVPNIAVLAGFSEPGPLEDALCAAVLRAGGQPWRLAGDAPAQDISIRPCQDARAEVLAAAGWAAGHLRAGGQPRLAIIVPDLAQLRRPLLRALDAELQPGAAWGAEPPVRLLNFSLGEPLARTPMVAAALALLEILRQPGKLEFALLCRLLRAAHWSDWPLENDARSRMERRLRKYEGAWISLPRAAELARKDGAIQAAGHLEAMAGLQREARRRREGREWSELLPQWLGQCGWPGARPLDSDEFQTRAAFEAEVAKLEGLTGLAPAGGLEAWSGLLARQCRERVFQPETRHRAFVEVLGPLEALGQRFDALWLMGLSDGVLPAAPRPNPLLPPQVQRAKGLPHASPEREQEFACTLLDALVRAAPEVVMSHARYEGDSALRPSPLLARYAKPLPAFEPNLAPLPDAPPLVAITDENGPPLAPDTTLAGGAQALAVQALCPLAAFVRYRLGAESWREPSPGPDASQRGTLLHLAMAHLWRTLKTQANLLALDRMATEAAVREAVALALAEFSEDNPGLLGPRLAELEAERLSRLLLDWLEKECLRAPFRVVAVEEDADMAIAGLRLKLKLDRLDQLDGEGLEGGQVILDYKTGKVNLADWSGPRLTSPQLPLYARKAAEENSVAAVAFARLKLGESAFLGVSRTAGLLPEVMPPGQAEGRKRPQFTDHADFDGLLAAWNGQLDTLAGELLAGFGANQAWVGDERLRYLDAWPLLRRVERDTEDEAEDL
ncbi:MAG: PD-(D/E)XK nuclease family protein [Rhodocyclaceae bacterium]|nr:PD-(D/E)XK nuclease family protein [Rhodocyclaceae bacterium]